MTPAETCRANGWQVGDVLVRYNEDEIVYAGVIVTVVIVAIGLDHVILRRKNGPGYDELADFYGRRWRKVGHMDPFADELVWP